MDLDQTTLLYRVRRTVLQMLNDRGYIVSNNKLNQSMEEFKETFNGSRDSLNLLVSKRKQEDEAEVGNEQQQKLIVFFPDSDKLNMEQLKKITLKMIEVNCFNAIVIIKGATQISRRVSMIPITHNNNDQKKNKYILFQLIHSIVGA